MKHPHLSVAGEAVWPRPKSVEAAGLRDDPLVDSFRKLAEVFQVVLSELELDAVLDRIADAVAELVPYDALTIYEADEKRSELFVVLARTDSWEEEISRIRPLYGQGITGWAAAHRQPVLTNAAHLDPRVSFVPGTPPDPEALIVVPLVARGALKGMLNIYRVGDDVLFADDEFELAKRFGDAAALALDNAQIRATLEHQAHTDSLTGLYNHRFFHERLRAEVNRCARADDTVALLIADIDDFKRINDVHGHALGDQLLIGMGGVIAEAVRDADVACRLGGEEFGVIMPSSSSEDALAFASRLRERLASVEFDGLGHVTVSIGIAESPQGSVNPRTVLRRADAALLTAKAGGKDHVVAYSEATDLEQADAQADGEDISAIAHLRMLQSLARKLNRLNSVHEIGMTVANELRVLLDYHSCRVYLRDGDDLLPIAFRGDGCAECVSDTPSSGCKLGEGITGRAAETGEPQRESFEADSDTPVAVPFMSGSRSLGVLVITPFEDEPVDQDDVRLLEMLADHASLALEKARTYERQRRQAERATELLAFADALLETGSKEAVGRETVSAVSRALGVSDVSLWLENDRSGRARCIAHIGQSSGQRSEPEIVRLSGVAGWIALRAPDDVPLDLSGERRVLLDELLKRASVALRG